MQAIFSDIDGKEIVKHQDPKDAQVLIGGVIFHMSQEQQFGLMTHIARLQAAMMPDRYEGDFEPYTDAQEIIDDYNARKEAAANQDPSSPDGLFE